MNENDLKAILLARQILDEKPVPVEGRLYYDPEKDDVYEYKQPLPYKVIKDE